jgi:Spy/CpxP family protein refolding chaperone
MNTPKTVVWQVWALIAVVFVLGCITGGGVSALYRARYGGDLAGGGPGGPRRMMHEKLKRDLALTEEQSTQVQTVLEDSRKDFRDAFNSCPQLKEARDNSAARIRALLTPEQQQKFDEIRARREEERRNKPAKE